MSFTKHQEPHDFNLQQLAITSAATSAALARKKRREKMSVNRAVNNQTPIANNVSKKSNPNNFESVHDHVQFQQKDSKEKVPPKKRKFNHVMIHNENNLTNHEDDTNENIPNQAKELNHAAEDAIESLKLLKAKSTTKSTADDVSIRTDDASIWNVHANTLLNLSGKHNQTQYTSLPIPHTRPYDLSPSPAVAIAAAAAASGVTSAPSTTMKPPSASPSTPVIPSRNPGPLSTSTAAPTSVTKPRKRSKKAVSAVEIAKAKEIRMLRNRASAAAHRQRNRNLIETLQKEVQTWKNKYNSAMDRQRELETELEYLKAQNNTSKNRIGTSPDTNVNIEKSEKGNTKKGPVWKKLIDVFSS